MDVVFGTKRVMVVRYSFVTVLGISVTHLQICAAHINNNALFCLYSLALKGCYYLTLYVGTVLW